jgi:Ca2+-binding RTX toxin-like protein
MPNTPVTWRRQSIVNTTTTGNQSDPDIIQLANGNILVSWTTDDAGGLGSPNGTETFAQIFDPLGNKIGAEIRLNQASTSGDEQNADLAALPGGGFIVVYHDLDNPATVPPGGSNIRLQEYDANGIIGSANALVVNDAGAGADPNFRNPVVAVSSATSVLIVYEQVTGGSSDLVGKIYNPTTNTYGAQFNILTEANSMGDADITVLTNGNYVITGNRSFTDNAIEYRIFDSAGANVLSATYVTGTNANAENDSEATVTALTGGGFVIAWTNIDADTDVEFRVYNAAGTQTASGFAGPSGNADNNNESKVIALADGTFVIAWDNDATFGVEVMHFSATGVQLGNTFVVSANNAESISGIGLGDGRFALVWDVNGGEISMEILDTRDTPNNPGVYTPDQWVVGTVGDDVFTPAANAEITHGGDGDDTITESGGTRAYYGDDGRDTILVNSPINADLHDGGLDNDTIDWIANSEVGSIFDLQAGTATSVSLLVEQMLNFENLNGTDNRDNILGTSGVNILNGNNGDDTIEGRGGADVINGGVGFDFASYLGAGGGVTARLDPYSALNTGEAAGDTYTGIEGLIGSQFSDFLLVGDATGNYIAALDGDDYIAGEGGDDSLRGDTGNDQIWGGTGADAIDGGSGYDIARYDFAASGVVARLDGGGNAGEAFGDTYVGIEALYGSAFGDILIGDNLGNVLVGLDGADLLYGLGGDDLLLGGAGIDAFAFNTAGFGTDTVLDFATTAAAGGSHDYVDFRGIPGLATFAITQSGADTLVTTNLGVVRLIGINSATLVAGDFLF